MKTIPLGASSLTRDRQPLQPLVVDDELTWKILKLKPLMRYL